MFEWLFDASSFVMRDQCGNWNTSIISLNLISNFIIFLSYVFISIRILVFNRRTKGRIEGGWYSWCLFSFILLCGLTHLSDVQSFFAATYNWFTVVDFACALVSIISAIILWILATYLETWIMAQDSKRKSVS